LGSSIYRVSDYPLLLSAGVEKAVASTKAMIAMMTYMILLSFSTAGKTDEAVEILEKSIKEIQRVIDDKSKIKKIAEKIVRASDIYVLGRGLSYAVAMEAALKIKEISYIHAEGFAGGELKHGPIALIEKNTPVIVFVPNDETEDASIANAMEVKARGAFVIGVSHKNNPVFDVYFEVADTGASSVLPNVVFAQLLAYYLTTAKGLNPDKPRNLAKSVVVR
jgi:glucosamine--fructose-6-phosphate aminotransferase (isomerizing)